MYTWFDFVAYVGLTHVLLVGNVGMETEIRWVNVCSAQVYDWPRILKYIPVYLTLEVIY